KLHSRMYVNVGATPATAVDQLFPFATTCVRTDTAGVTAATCGSVAMASPSPGVSVEAAGPRANAVQRHVAGDDDHEVAPDAVDLRRDGRARARSDRDGDHDRGDADDHAEHRQQRTHAIADERAPRDADQGPKAHTGTVCSAAELAGTSPTMRPSRKVTMRCARRRARA